MEPTNHLVIIEEEQTLEKENDTGVKRVEPLRGSERFLDSLSRIPEGTPTTNVIVQSPPHPTLSERWTYSEVC